MVGVGQQRQGGCGGLRSERERRGGGGGQECQPAIRCEQPDQQRLQIFVFHAASIPDNANKQNKYISYNQTFSRHTKKQHCYYLQTYRFHHPNQRIRSCTYLPRHSPLYDTLFHSPCLHIVCALIFNIRGDFRGRTARRFPGGRQVSEGGHQHAPDPGRKLVLARRPGWRNHEGT